MKMTKNAVDVVEERVAVGTRELLVVHPRRPDELIDEEAFARDEFLPYWAELWPSGVALARAVTTRVRPGATVVELGCGLAVPSIVAALGGADVLATDWSPDAIACLRQNAIRNGAPVQAAVVAWSDPGALVERAPWDLVLAADVLYETRNVGPLLSLLPKLVDRGGRVLFTDPGRPAAHLFLEAASAEWRISRLAGDPESPRVALYELAKRT